MKRILFKLVYSNLFLIIWTYAYYRYSNAGSLELGDLVPIGYIGGYSFIFACFIIMKDYKLISEKDLGIAINLYMTLAMIFYFIVLNYLFSDCNRDLSLLNKIYFLSLFVTIILFIIKRKKQIRLPQ